VQENALLMIETVSSWFMTVDSPRDMRIITHRI